MIHDSRDLVIDFQWVQPDLFSIHIKRANVFKRSSADIKENHTFNKGSVGDFHNSLEKSDFILSLFTRWANWTCKLIPNVSIKL